MSWAHVKLVNSAWDFLFPIGERGDLRAAWPFVDPTLRLCLVQQWLIDNEVELEEHGYERDAVASALADEDPDHELWEHFERVHLREWRRILPSSDVWGIGENTRTLAPDVELLYLHDTSTLEGASWQPGERRWVFPLLMRRSTRQVLNLGSELIPQPGWPPDLGHRGTIIGDDVEPPLPPLAARSAQQLLESFVRQTIERLSVASLLEHPGEVGRARENALRDHLRSFLPPSLGVSTGFVIDALGGRSKQMDVIIHFADYHAVFNVNDVPLVPIEAVIAVIEIKSDASSRKVLHECYEIIASCKRLDKIQRQ